MAEATIKVGVDSASLARAWQQAITVAEGKAKELREKTDKSLNNPPVQQKLGQAAEGANKVAQGLERVGKLFVVANAAAQLTAGVMKVVESLTADTADNAEKQKNAVAAVEGIIKNTVPFGQKILDIGKTINEQTIGRLTGEKAVLEQLAKQAKEQEKQIAATDVLIKKRQDFTASLAKFAGEQQAESGGGSAEQRFQRDIQKRRDDLAKLLASPEAKDKQGNLTATAAFEADRARQGIAERERQFAEEQAKVIAEKQKAVAIIAAQNRAAEIGTIEADFAAKRLQLEVDTEKKITDARKQSAAQAFIALQEGYVLRDKLEGEFSRAVSERERKAAEESKKMAQEVAKARLDAEIEAADERVGTLEDTISNARKQAEARGALIDSASRLDVLGGTAGPDYAQQQLDVAKQQLAELKKLRESRDVARFE